MQPIPWAVFSNADVRLRVWVGHPTNGFELLSPDQRISAVGYAMMAMSIPDATVTAQKLATGAVTSAHLAEGAVTSAKLGTASVTPLALADGAVTVNKLAAGSVTSAKLAPGSVTTPAIADGAVTPAKLSLQLGYINAQNPPYLAKGDGTNNDTAPIQAALNDVGAKGGGIVFLPRGNYYVAGHLSVPADTTLAGTFRAPPAYAQNYGTTLLAVEGAGNTSGVPFLTLVGHNSTLEGVTIFYPNQVLQNPPTPYPWTIRAGGGDNVTVQNVLLVNPYLAVDFATQTSGRHLIRGLYGQPLLVGIAVDQCYDIGRILDVHFWPFWTQDTNVWAFQASQAVSFDFMRTDWEVVQDIFSFGYHIGARFRASASGDMNGQMSNINFDNVDIGMDLSSSSEVAIHVANLNIANAGAGTNRIGIRALPGDAANLNVSGASFWGSIRQPISWNCSGLLTLANARFLSWDSAVPAVDILGGRAMLHGSYFKDVIGTAVHVGTNTDRVMILGNELVGNSLSLEGPRTLEAGNHY
jgi:hypothetical protein